MRHHLITTKVDLMMPKNKRGIKKRLMNKIRSLFSRHQSSSRRLRHSETSSAAPQPIMTEKVSNVRHTQPAKQASRGIRFSRRAVQRSKYLREKFGVRKTVMGFSPRVGSITEEDENEITLWSLAENAENVISNGLAWLKSDFKDYDSDDDDFYDDDEKILQKWVENNSFEVMQVGNDIDNDADDKALTDDDDDDDDVFESGDAECKDELSNDASNDADDDNYYDKNDDDDEITSDENSDYYAMSEGGDADNCINIPCKVDNDDNIGLCAISDGDDNNIDDDDSNNACQIDGDAKNNKEVYEHKDNAYDDDNAYDYDDSVCENKNRPGVNSTGDVNAFNIDENGKVLEFSVTSCDISEDYIKNNNKREDTSQFSKIHHNHKCKEIITCKGKAITVNASSSHKCNYVDVNSNDCLRYLSAANDKACPRDKHHDDAIVIDTGTIKTVSIMHEKDQDKNTRVLANRETTETENRKTENLQNKAIIDKQQRSRENTSYNDLWTLQKSNESIYHTSYSQIDDDDDDYVWVSDVICDVTCSSKSDVTTVDFSGRSSVQKKFKVNDVLQNRVGSMSTNIDHVVNGVSSNNQSRTKEKEGSSFELAYSICGEPETLEETATVSKLEHFDTEKGRKLSCGEDENDVCLDNVLNSVKEEIEGVWNRISTLENDFNLARTTMNDMKTTKKD